MRIQVVYDDRQVADAGQQAKCWSVPSPSARKPKELIARLLAHTIPGMEITVVPTQPVIRTDFYAAHDPSHVDDILELRKDNGFGSRSQSVADSLPWTSGAMLTAARVATTTSPACAPVSGFHHAGYGIAMGFCSLNGLMVTAAKLASEGKKVAIIDADAHYGNGTDDILANLPYLKDAVYHFSFGKHIMGPAGAKSYLKYLDPSDGLVRATLGLMSPDVILYQAGADVHIDDPYGGILTTEQMLERDRRMFTIAKMLNIPIAWNLAGGYQVDADGNIDKVLELHLNTFRACVEVYGEVPCTT